MSQNYKKGQTTQTSNVKTARLLWVNALKIHFNWVDLTYTRRQINQDGMIFGDFSVTSEPIFLKFCIGYFYSNPNSSKNFAKLYWIFQKLDHLTCNKILELV